MADEAGFNNPPDVLDVGVAGVKVTVVFKVEVTSMVTVSSFREDGDGDGAGAGAGEEVAGAIGV